jgi:hypothetical protein
MNSQAHRSWWNDGLGVVPPQPTFERVTMIEYMKAEEDKEITQFWIDRCLKLEAENARLQADNEKHYKMYWSVLKHETLAKSAARNVLGMDVMMDHSNNWMTPYYLRLLMCRVPRIAAPNSAR